MGLRLEVIQYLDELNTSVVQRVPPDGTADIKYGAQLIVNAMQEAVFFRDGKAMDTFGPGRHTLTTNNIPLITRILTIPWEKSPFQACVYYVGKQTFVDQKWGTRQPITFRDRDFGIVRLRSFGKYSFRVVDSALLLNTLVGTQGKYSTEEVTAYLKDVIVSRLTDLLGTTGVSLLDLAARYDEIAAATRAKVSEEFSKYGLEMVDLFINAITPPDEVQAAIDARSSMGIVGDMNSYVKYQAAQSMNKMAENGGGNAMGLGMGMVFPGMMQNVSGPGAAAAGAAGPSGQYVPPQLSAPPSPQAFPSQSSGGNLASSSSNSLGKLDIGELASVVTDPREVVRAVVKSSDYKIEENGNDWTITVPIGTLRKQKIFVRFGRKEENNNSIVTFSSVCGPASEKNAMTLLRYNNKLVYGAFAVDKVGGADSVVIQANFLAEMLSPLSVTQSLSAIAWQADQVEDKISGTDVN
jgi:membrane protease subunit (stomatin/prohibitin family)